MSLFQLTAQPQSLHPRHPVIPFIPGPLSVGFISHGVGKGPLTLPAPLSGWLGLSGQPGPSWREQGPRRLPSPPFGPSSHCDSAWLWRLSPRSRCRLGPGEERGSEHPRAGHGALPWAHNLPFRAPGLGTVRSAVLGGPAPPARLMTPRGCPSAGRSPERGASLRKGSVRMACPSCRHGASSAGIPAQPSAPWVPGSGQHCHLHPTHLPPDCRRHPAQWLGALEGRLGSGARGPEALGEGVRASRPGLWHGYPSWGLPWG